MLLTSSAHAAEQYDIRVLIDISGSMKENDPKNLRSSALRMLVQLLPRKSSAGVWTFGQYVNMLVKHGEISDVWKNSALRSSREINSLGLYTNIEHVLQKSTYNWNKQDPSKRILILLTDGYVDISKDSSINAASKKRILETELSRLKKAKARIFTVALSANADHDFLKYLSSSTDGLYIRADSPSELNHAFLNIFENTVKANTLPISKNTFKVDKSISDMTLVLFHGENSKKINLYSPDKSVYTHEYKGKNLKWYSDTNYELITVSKPSPGDWFISGDFDQNSKILVVTNLKLTLNKIPNNMFPGEKFSIQPLLLQQDKEIQDERFIQLVKYDAELSRKTGTRELKPVLSEAKKVEFTVTDRILQEGKNQVRITARSPTFTREISHSVNYFKNLLEFNVYPDASHGKAVIKLSPASGLALGNIEYFGTRKPEKSDIKIRKNENGSWSAEIPEKFSDQVVQFHVMAELNSSKFNIYKTITIPGFRKNNPVTPPPVAIKKPLAVAASPKNNEKKSNDAGKPASADNSGNPEKSFSWITVVVSVVGVNVAIILVGFGVFRLMRKRNTQEDEIFSVTGDKSIEDTSGNPIPDEGESIEEFDGIEELDANETRDEDQKNDSVLQELADDLDLDNPTMKNVEIPTLSPEEAKQ